MPSATPASSQPFSIPIVDFSPLLSTSASQPSTPAQQAAAASLLHGFQTAGFIYLRNHGIPRTTIRDTFAASAQFFARPENEKLSLSWTTPAANRGYSQPGREKTTDAQDAAEIEAIRAREGADLKESFEIGREPDARDAPEENFANPWPTAEGDDDGAAESFRTTMIHFHDVCRDLHILIMRAIAIALGLEDEGWFDGYTARGDNTLRLLHYPSVQAKVFRDNEFTVRAGAHTDYGSITCLFQDMAGGLQVLSPDGKTYVDATPIEDTIVVNAGDLLARWSNDTIKSTKHRVVEPPSTVAVHPARYSMAYFCNPDFDKLIDAIPGTYGPERPKKYPSVNSGEYLIQRLSATY